MDGTEPIVRPSAGPAHGPTVPTSRGDGSTTDAKKPPVRAGGFLVLEWWTGVAGRSDQWAQERAEPSSSAVRKLDPQPHAATAFGLFTVKPAPISVST